jgi:hypothetical protein
VIGGLAVTGLVIGGIAFAMSGDDDAPSGPRDPWTDPVVPPQTPEEIAALRQVLCTCFRGGATELDALTVCALKQVYAEVPWPAQAGDHPSLASVTNTVRLTAADLLKQPTAAARDAWCGTTVDPPPPDGPTPDEPTDVPDTPEARADLIRTFTTGKEGGFTQPVGGQTLTGLVEKAYAIPSTPVQRVRAVLRCQVLSVWNLLMFGVPESGNDYGHAQYNGRWYSLKAVMLPRNEDVIARVLANAKVRRTVGWSDADATGAGFRYGLVWNRHVARSGGVISCDSDIFAPENNPPADVLAAMGWTLEGLKQAFLESPLAG